MDQAALLLCLLIHLREKKTLFLYSNCDINVITPHWISSNYLNVYCRPHSVVCWRQKKNMSI